MEKLWIWLPAASLAVLFAFIAGCGGGNAGPEPVLPEPVPAEIQRIFDKPAYRNGSWALRVVDLDSGRIIHDVNSGRPRLIASVPPCTSRGRSAAPAFSPET
jgi:D-alanyl-D-alanine carboxypeptidase